MSALLLGVDIPGLAAHVRYVPKKADLPWAADSVYAAFTTPVAAIRLTMNALSSAGGRVTATILQAGIG